MHEFSLMADLLQKIESVADYHEAQRVVGVSVKIGALAHISADHFREHFVELVRGTRADGAQLDIEASDNPGDRYAQDILLKNVEVA